MQHLIPFDIHYIDSMLLQETSVHRDISMQPLPPHPRLHHHLLEIRAAARQHVHDLTHVRVIKPALL